jgi:hypothetical protein
VIDFNADVETAELEEAAEKLRKADAIVGIDTGPAEALGMVRNAIDLCVEDGTYEDRLQQGLLSVSLAIDDIAEFSEHLQHEWQAGRVRAANDTVLDVVGLLNGALDALHRWLDYAEHELREIA